jgi:hydrogenase 3 maturation protease
MPRAVVIGIGSEFNGDDAAGIEAVRRLQVDLAGVENLLALDGGAAPENATAPIRRFAPGLVIMIDCAAMEAAPGTIAWLKMEDLDGLSASTHTLPPSVLAKYLQAELGCDVGLIGIQPESLAFGAPLSAAVSRAVDEVVSEFVRLFSSGGGTLLT